MNRQFRRAGRAIKYILLALILAAFSAALIIRPERYIQQCFEGIALWAQCVLPSLFPFMVVCAILTNTGIAARASAPLSRAAGVLRLPPAAAACFVMSISSGYPAGSRTVSEFYSAGYVNAEGCKKLACLCSTSGPLFVIGTVGVKMFSSASAGFALFFAHAGAVLLCSLIFSLAGRPCGGGVPLARLRGDVLQESFYGAVSAALTAGAFIAFFYTAALMAQDFRLLYPVEKLICLFADEAVAKAVCAGLVEMTGGIALLAKSGSALAVPFAGFLITFGGACVLLQQLSYLTKAGIKPSVFIIHKFVQGAVCFLLLLPFA